MAIVLFDLDNTIADMDHRLHLIDKADPDWDLFESECDLDTPIWPTIRLMESLAKDGHQVWIWTGRSDAVRDETIAWLRQWHVMYDQLIMRPHADPRPTEKLKKDWLDNNPVPKDRVLCAFDDDERICKMLHKEGLTVYQVFK